MRQSYEAVLVADRIQWQDEAPHSQGPIRVMITILDDDFPTPPKSNGPAMAGALKEISDRGGMPGMIDPIT